MMPILPPELTYTILESTILSAHDLTKIALTSRSLLPVARKLLYHSIEVYHRPQPGYMLNVPGRYLAAGTLFTGDPDSTKGCATALEVFSSNPLLPTLVQKLHINSAESCYEGDNTAFLSRVIPLCTNLEALICTNRKWDPKGLAAIVAKVKHKRSMKGQTTKLKVHLEEATIALAFRRQTDPLDLPLSSFRVGDLDHQFAANYLASSASSLQAIELDFRDVSLYQRFTNVSTLFLRQTPLSQNWNSDTLLSKLAHFQRLETLLLSTPQQSGIILSLCSVLFRLPSTLRSLSLECFFPSKETPQFAACLPPNTPLQKLNLYSLSLPVEGADLAEAKEICQRKGVKLTIGEKWNVWDNLCRSSSLTSHTRS